MSAQNHALQTSRSVRLRFYCLLDPIHHRSLQPRSAALAQTVVATIPAGGTAVAVNPVTNKIYAIGGDCNGKKQQPPSGTVTVGSTYTTTTITADLLRPCLP